ANHVRAAAMIGTYDLSHVLGVKPSRQRRRTHKVAEHDRELATFSRSSLRCLRNRGIGCGRGCCVNGSCRQSVTAFQAELGTRRIRAAARRTASKKSRTALQAEFAAFGKVSIAARTSHGSSPCVPSFITVSKPKVRDRD